MPGSGRPSVISWHRLLRIRVGRSTGSSVRPVELLDEESHRLLVWAVLLADVGHAPTRRELRRVSEPRGAADDPVADALAGRDVEYREGAISSLVRRGLLEGTGVDGLTASVLGRRVVDALGLLGTGGLPDFEVLDADLRSGDQLAFARVVGRMAGLHRPMLVDPYCGRDQLEYVASHTTVNRVLVSDRLSDGELDDLAAAVRSMRGRPVKLRLRVGPADLLSDRCVVSEERVLLVGGLPRADGAGATALCEVHDGADAVRAHYRAAWKSAERLATSQPERRTRMRIA